MSASAAPMSSTSWDDLDGGTDCACRAIHLAAPGPAGRLRVLRALGRLVGLSGQVLRGFTVEAEPTSLYRDLHATAAAASMPSPRRSAPGSRRRT